MKYSLGLAAVLCTLATALPASSAQADEKLTSEGIGGYMDSKHRNPVLAISIAQPTDPARVKITADASVPNEELNEYPIRFDFFVNGRLFSSQIRSRALPTPVGVDIGRDIATLPFNYSVVATVIHPNRQYTSMIEGAVFEQNLVSTFDCTATLTKAAQTEDAEDTVEEFVGNDIQTAQSASKTITFNFQGKEAASGDSLDFQVTLQINTDDSTASGSLSYTRDGETTSADVSGDVQLDDSGQLSSFTLSNDDSTVELSCL